MTDQNITPADFTRIKRDLSRLLGAISGPVTDPRAAQLDEDDRAEICLKIAGIVRISAEMLADAGFDTDAVGALVDSVEAQLSEPAGCPAR